MSDDTRGPLLIIGGHEDKTGDRVILRTVAEHVRGRKLVLATVASHAPDGYFTTYQQAFAELGVTDLVELYVQERGDTLHGETDEILRDAAGVFFTGGDQLRISSQIAGTPVEAFVRDLHARGGLIAGTSAGASVMSETMLVKAPSGASFRIGELHMAPGLGLLSGMIIDQHFAERGRIGRLLGAVAHNPRELGVGIDEDTAILVTGRTFRVLGAGAVTVVDGLGVTHSNIAEARPERTLSMHDVMLHMLADGDRFDLDRRRPVGASDGGD
ncbi:MAG TPA: cyanophycinase [Sphingomonas sp.]